MASKTLVDLFEDDDTKQFAELVVQFERETTAGETHQWAAGDILLKMDTLVPPEVVTKRLKRYEKSYLSKLRSTCNEFAREDRTKAIEAEATFHDCYQTYRLMARAISSSDIASSARGDRLIPLLNMYLAAKAKDPATAYAEVLAKVAPRAAKRHAAVEAKVETFFDIAYKHDLPLDPFDKRWERVEKMVWREARSLALSDLEGGIAVACLLQGDRPILTGASTFGTGQRRDNALLALALLSLRSIKGDLLTALGTLQSMAREADQLSTPIIDEALKARLRELGALLSVESPAAAPAKRKAKAKRTEPKVTIIKQG